MSDIPPGHLGGFADWAEVAARRHRLFGPAAPGPATVRRIRAVLRFLREPARPPEVRLERRWETDGVQGEELSWTVGYGPRTHGFVLRPAGADRPLPGVLALHGHDGVKYWGKEKIVDGAEPTPTELGPLRDRLYAGRPFPNDLARTGFVVLAHDAFLWGSRRFPLATMPAPIRQSALDWQRARRLDGTDPGESATYDVAAAQHEHLIAKYCTLLGTTLAGVVSHEDRLAARYLRSRPDVAGGPIGCVGLSGGGCRAALLQATCPAIGAAVIVGMMSTYEDLLDRLVAPHTWMFFPAGLSRFADWPDLAAARAPSPLYVQYCDQDYLFTPAGMRRAHERIAGHYRSVGQAHAYRGDFFPVPHCFDREMQAAAFTWLGRQLGS